MKYSILLAIIALFLMTNCEFVEEGQQGEDQQLQPFSLKEFLWRFVEETPQTAEKEGVVWKIHEEMTSGLGNETRDGTATFYDHATVKIQDGVVDISYAFEYYDEGAKIQLTNREMSEDILNFVIVEDTETKRVWERLENDVQSVWTMTK
jgi:hypothetical protein